MYHVCNFGGFCNKNVKLQNSEDFVLIYNWLFMSLLRRMYMFIK